MKNKAPIRKYDITQCALYKCRTKKRLEHLLCLEPGSLKIIDSIIGYHKFEIDKKHSNERREITAPDKILKAIQRRILYSFICFTESSGLNGSFLEKSRSAI